MASERVLTVTVEELTSRMWRDALMDRLRAFERPRRPSLSEALDLVNLLERRGMHDEAAKWRGWVQSGELTP